MRRNFTSSTVSVYAGRTCLGSIQRRGDAFVAIDVDGGVVGKFETLHEAADALEADNHS